MSARILIVDDDPVQRRLLKGAVEREGMIADTADDGNQAVKLITNAEKPYDAVVLDLVMPGMDGLSVLAWMSENGHGTPAIVQTGLGGIETVVKAMRAGAFDFVVKPVSPERLMTAIGHARKAGTKDRNSGGGAKITGGFADIVVASPAMDRILSLAKRAAASDIPVVLEGESGVGKEMIARAIQIESARRARPYVTVNCGAIPASLVESILFGHEKGAFTGAVDNHTGKFVEADRGTLFLDEVGDLPPEVQVKLLRAVQTGEIETVGARDVRKVDIRLISATNKDLIEEVKAGRFREDLYYRLNVVQLTVPPLRERMGDIPALCRHLLARIAGQPGLRSLGLTDDALSLLMQHPWPGNVRQLQNALFRAAVLCEGDALTPQDFPQIAAQIRAGDMIDRVTPRVRAISQPHRDGAGITLFELDGHVRQLAEIEADVIRLAIGHYRGRMTEVARRLGIGRSTLYRKLAELGIDSAA